VLKLFDTNVLISIRDDDRVLLGRYAEIVDRPAMSVVSKVELDNGIFRDPTESHARALALDVLLEDIDVLPFGTSESEIYRKIVATTGYSRARTLDRMIAATALGIGATLVTANVRDFRDIPELQIEDWSN